MINLVWAVLLLAGVGVGLATGRVQEISEAAMQSAQDAVTLCITLLGAYVLWLGVMGIAERSGLVKKLSRGLQRLLRPLFPSIPDGHSAWSYISMNIAANMLGMGNAATPAGLRAMQELNTINPDKTRASKAMCMLLLINASSVQLIPTTVISLRAAAGSANPSDIILPALLATTFSTAVAILLAKLMERRSD